MGEGSGFGNNYSPAPGFEITDSPAGLPVPLPMPEQHLPAAEYPDFAGLRNGVHAYQYAEMYHRIHTSPAPSAAELHMGCYAEEIEPQVRDAVLALWDKGYTTWSSGFMNNAGAEGRSDLQVIEGRFDLSAETVSALAERGISAESGKLSFTPSAPDLSAITATWRAVADLLPANPSPSQPPARTAPENFSPTAYFESWLNYGLGVTARPGLVTEIERRATPTPQQA